MLRWLVASVLVAASVSVPTRVAAEPALDPVTECEVGLPADLRVLAGRMDVLVVCREAASDAAGMFFLGGYTRPSVAVVEARAGTPPGYYGQVLAHELGHAWMCGLTTERVRAVRATLELPAESDPDGCSEHLADVVALHFGYWRDHGTGWRTGDEGPAPSTTQLERLRAAGLLPERT